MGVLVITSRHFSLLCILLDAPQPSCQHKEGSPVKAGVSAATIHRPQVPPQGPAGAAPRAAQVPAGLLLGAAQGQSFKQRFARISQAPTSDFTIMTLLTHHAKQTLIHGK